MRNTLNHQHKGEVQHYDFYSDILYGFLKNYNSKDTVKAYTSDLKKYFKFIKQYYSDIKFTEINHKHLIFFRDKLIEDGVSERSIVRILAALNSFYNYLMDLDLIDTNPTVRVKRPKFNSDIKTQDLTDEQLEKSYGLFDRSKPSGKLHYALWVMFFKTGLRHSAITNLKFKDLVEVNDMLCFKYEVKGRGKDIKPMNNEMMSALGDYLSWCEDNNYSMDEEDYVFRPTTNQFGNRNKKLCASTVNYIFKKVQKGLGIKGSISPHSARATVVGQLLEKGESLYQVSEFVNHKDPKTTKGYSKRKSGLKDSFVFGL